MKELISKRLELASRIERADQILATREVRRIGWDLYQVESQNTPGRLPLGRACPRSCDCYDFVNGRAPGQFCKHAMAIRMMQKAQAWEMVERRGQMFAHLVAQGVPVMAALQQVGAS